MDLFRSVDDIIERINTLSRLVENYPDTHITPEQLEELENCWYELELIITVFDSRLPKRRDKNKENL